MRFPLKESRLFTPRPTFSSGIVPTAAPTGVGPASRAGLAGVLIIDDEPAIRALVQLGLQEQGLSVWSAGSGREGVDVYQALHDRIGVVLLDVKMPDLDGPRTLPLLQQVNADICCCFVTGDTGVYDEQELLALGAAKVLRKPFSLSHLSELMLQMLGNLQHGQAAERRQTARCACESECRWHLHAEEPRPARIQDVSAQGISLVVGRSLEPGMVVNVEIRQSDRRPLSRPARVIHVTPASGSEAEWIVGCVFADRLANSELEALLVGASS